MRLLPRSGAHRRRHALPRATARRLPIPRLSLSRPSVLRQGRRVRSVERRRARALLVAAVLFATVVLLSALPWSALADQHAQLTSASAEVSQLQAQNQALARQAQELADRATQAGLARQDFGLVEPGQKAYDLLPAPGTATPAATEAGHVPLDEPPVVPGSRRSAELLGVGVGSTTPAPPSGQSARMTTGPAHGGPHRTGGETSTDRLGEGGFWSRVAHTLEFWS